jgi:two-component system CheB/CheR fusion protein
MINLIESTKIKQAIELNPQDVLNIIENTSLGICITDQHGNYVAVNKPYCQVYEYTKEELIGHSFTLVVPEEHREHMQILHRKFLRDKREIAREWTVLTKSNKAIHISVDAAYSEKIFGETPHKITFVHFE